MRLRPSLGAGTQVFTQGIGNAVFGTSELSTDLSLGAGWAINLAVAEYVTRRGMRSSRPVPQLETSVSAPPKAGADPSDLHRVLDPDLHGVRDPELRAAH